MRKLAPLLVAACVVGQAPAAGASWIFEADTGLVHETNVGLAQKARDVKSDTALSTEISTGLAIPLDDRFTASVTGDVGGNGYAQLHGLDNLAVGLTTALRGKFGLGSAAPWLRVWGSGARLEYDDAVRDGWRYRVGAGVGKQVGERWDLQIDYTFEERMADHAKRSSTRLPGDVFDTTSHTYSGRVDFHYNDALTVFAGYALREGEVVSTTRRNAEIFAGSTALTPDRPFGPDFFAYKIDATVHILSFGASFALGERSSLNFGYERQIGLGRGGLDYYNDVFRAGILFTY